MTEPSTTQRRRRTGRASAAVAMLALALLASACSSSESPTLEDVGLAVEADIQAGSTLELAVAVDANLLVSLLMAPPGVSAAISQTEGEPSMLLTVAVEHDTPRGAYNLALLVTRDGQDFELGWPFEVVEPVGAGEAADAVATTQPALVEALTTVVSP